MTTAHDALVECPCPLCGGSRAIAYAEENGFRLVRCSECTTLYVTPRPDLEATAVAHQYGLHRGETALTVTGRYRPRRIWKYKRILNDIYGPSLPAEIASWLDIGCGHGEFLSALRGLGGPAVALHGLEPNLRKAAGCIARGFDVKPCVVEKVSGTFTAISLLNVFSHIPEPRDFIRQCVKRLSPGGELLLETGDTADLPSEHHPQPFYLPDHLVFANEPIVRQLLTDAQFHVISVHKYCAASPFPWPVVQECRLAARSQRFPHPVMAFRRWLTERRRRVDMFVRARLAV